MARIFGQKVQLFGTSLVINRYFKSIINRQMNFKYSKIFLAYFYQYHQLRNMPGSLNKGSTTINF